MRVAKLVHAENIDPALSEALRSPDALVRATAARVAGVRNAKGVLPVLREVAPGETDPSALREEIRTLALIGETADVDIAIAAASKQSASYDGVVADAVARRGGEEAIELYMAKVRHLRDTSGFFERALWGHEEAVSTTAGWLLSSRVAGGWRAFLAALFEAANAPPQARMIAGLENGSEDIRQETAWFLVRGYAADPGRLHENLRATLLADRTEQAGDREDFARELLRRMLGKPPSTPERWLKWLATKEADDRLPTEPAVYTYLTPEELALREARCKNLPVWCPVTPKRRGPRVYPSKAVAKSPFSLPSTLPAGLAEKLAGRARCWWLGVAGATVDHAGRVQSIDLKSVDMMCRDALETIVKLSYATNRTIASSTRTNNILLVKARNAAVCLDEVVDDFGALARADEPEVAPPLPKRRVEPRFPAVTRGAMGRNSSVIVIVESVISRTGCVRSINLLSQSEWSDLNGAVVLALSQWTFEPARVGGKPADAIFNLTANFKVD